MTLEVLEELGEKAEPVEGPGAADSRFFTPYGVKAIDFGPRGGNIHGPNEYVEIDSLRKMPALYAELARRLVRSSQRPSSPTSLKSSRSKTR